MINIILIEGHLGKDPELKKTGSGTPLCSFTVCQTIKRQVRGEEAEFPQWYEVTCYGRLAENHAKNLYKGRRVLVNGSLFVEDWTAKNGKEGYTMKITASEVNYLDAPTRRGGIGDERSVAQTQNAADPVPPTGAADNFERFDVEQPLTAGVKPTPWS